LKLIYLIHITAGALGLLSGYTALAAAKGAALHRRIGMVFFYSMLVVCALGSIIAVARNKAPGINVPASILTSYLVITSLIAVRPMKSGERPTLIALMIVALALGLTEITLGIGSLSKPGALTFGYFIFGFVGTVGALGDLRVIRHGALKGGARIARHLWRMSFGLFIAAISFSSRPKVFPAPLRIPVVMMAPPLLVLIVIIYYMWKIRFRKNFRGIARPRETRMLTELEQGAASSL
jgi:hypothetical protein